MSTSQFTHFSNSRLFTVLSSIITHALITQTSRFDHPIVLNSIVWATVYWFHCVATQRKTKHKKRQTNSCCTVVRTCLINSWLTYLFPFYCLLSRRYRNRTHDFTHLSLTKFIWIYIRLEISTQILVLSLPINYVSIRNQLYLRFLLLPDFLIYFWLSLTARRLYKTNWKHSVDSPQHIFY